jgi:YVTN family beta-propeller protein
MNRRILALICIAGIIAFNSCKKDPKAPPEVLGDIYILNEGTMGMNNASLSCYNSQTKELSNDYFLEKNKRGLGDIANDLKAYGGKLYCVVNGSNTVEVMNLYTGESVKQIPLPNKSPRSIAFWKNKAYVCSFDGTVVQIDTASLAVEKSVKAGRNPEDLCVSNGKLYVSNSGGLDYPNYDSTVSVIDLQTFTEIKKIPVGVNPCRIQADDYGNVFLVVMGNYDDVQTTFKCISSQIDTVTDVFNIPATNFTLSGNTAYLYQYDYFGSGTFLVKEFNVLSKQIVKDNFLSETVAIQVPYGISVHPKSGDVYITDSRQFRESGDVHCFDKNGKKKFSLSVGVGPSKVVFVK